MTITIKFRVISILSMLYTWLRELVLTKNGICLAFHVLNAILAIWHKRHKPEDYLSHWYNKETIMRTYAHKIFSIKDQEEWLENAKTPMIKPTKNTTKET